MMNRLPLIMLCLLFQSITIAGHANAMTPAAQSSLPELTVMLWNRWTMKPVVDQWDEHLIALNLQGEIIYDIRLAASSGERVRSVGVAHSGQRVAIVVVNEAAETVDLRVIDLSVGCGAIPRLRVSPALLKYRVKIGTYVPIYRPTCATLKA